MLNIRKFPISLHRFSDNGNFGFHNGSSGSSKAFGGETSEQLVDFIGEYYSTSTASGVLCGRSNWCSTLPARTELVLQHIILGWFAKLPVQHYKCHKSNERFCGEHFMLGEYGVIFGQLLSIFNIGSCLLQRTAIPSAALHKL